MCHQPGDTGMSTLRPALEKVLRLSESPSASNEQVPMAPTLRNPFQSVSRLRITSFISILSEQHNMGNNIDYDREEDSVGIPHNFNENPDRHPIHRASFFRNSTYEYFLNTLVSKYPDEAIEVLKRRHLHHFMSPTALPLP